MPNYPEKKSTQLEIRLTHSKKSSFMKACEENGVTASEVLREFIDAYLRRSRSMKLKNLAKDVAMKLIRNPVKTGIGSSLAVLAGLTASVLLPGTSVAEGQYVQPLNYPKQAVYPKELAQKGVEGKCEVRFSVDAQGVVEPGAKADCTHEGFVRSAENAVYSLQFEPRMKNGKPVRMPNVVYPFEFLMSYEPQAEKKDFRP
ncbi:energy transducer TonB [Ponticaulis profundi]|uniref:Energy transducer TonB n=1 Tax=Ponticaulis profundi TaxID=2665222 RepID=A0ABW1S876_9PROT